MALPRVLGGRTKRRVEETAQKLNRLGGARAREGEESLIYDEHPARPQGPE